MIARVPMGDQIDDIYLLLIVGVVVVAVEEEGMETDSRVSSDSCYGEGYMVSSGILMDAN